VTGGMEDGAPDPELPLVVIRRRTWRRMCGELRYRGEGRRESGAFLLAPADETAGRGTRGTVTAVVYYDDLDAHCLTGGITLSGSAFDGLWRICKQQHLRVVADVHTHPSSWVDQSYIDATNPMMALPGHVALIIGNFAASQTEPSSIGAHRYLGAHTWQHIAHDKRAQAIRLIGIDPAATCRRWFAPLTHAARRLWRPQREETV
jgi:hypothetical protein